MLTEVKTRAIELDFTAQKASEGRAAIHEYPAMLHYLLVDNLLSLYAPKDSTVYDPFCGSGVTIIETLKTSRKVIGTDLNPLALLIAEARTLNLYQEKVASNLKKIKNDWGSNTADVPEITNIEYWFNPDVIEGLGKIRKSLRAIDDKTYGLFFKTVFSQTVRNVSNNKKGEFKRNRINKEKLDIYRPRVWETFERIALKYSQILTDPLLYRDFKLFRHDARQPLPFNDKVDIVITSPPYGDSKTTVAYGQFSSFSMEWIKGLNPYGDGDLTLDGRLLGGKKGIFGATPSVSLKQTLNKIQDENRKEEVNIFFSDLFLSCNNIIKCLSDHPTVCLVVGNRTVNGITIPMDEIVKEFFEHFGLKHLKTLVRKINNKRMPALNSPSNVKGYLSPTMTAEYIVIMKG
ncbi:DNA adenine methylase [candidate division TA06 bacterium]|uniref:site-specific DNA-methyltransferase (cytosine-N(4)-specific) n=1 Tax=candidate division TA06 bacterium TaxID=2250710 RepID=A0A933IAI4_UNCT6|nr:DNA adenine methylase [candidate division TA06 bacterium]